GYFATLGLPLRRGRAFTDADGAEGQESAIVNEHIAAEYFPNQDPIGRRNRLTHPGATSANGPSITIVGVSKAVGEPVPGGRPSHHVYVPYRFDPRASMTVIVRARSDVGQTVARLREEVVALDPDIPLFDVQTMDEWMAFLRWPERVFGTLFSLFALIALIMSAVGVHAVTAQSVA